MATPGRGLNHPGPTLFYSHESTDGYTPHYFTLVNEKETARSEILVGPKPTRIHRQDLMKPKRKPQRGPEPERLKIDMPWGEAVKKAVTKKPRTVKKKRK